MNMTATATGLWEQDAGTSQYLTFLLAGEEYGVNILKVKEIRGWEQPTLLPNTAEYVLGVINLRGMVVPVMDLRKRFGMQEIELGKTAVVVVVKVTHSGRERTIGLVVDAVSEVYNISEDMIMPSPDLGGTISDEYVKGLVTIQGKMIILLDIDYLINEGMLKDAESSQE
jgi:purine-binding chemotaxis protein CheW